MAAPPVLLVADDLAIIASVKRVLAREGYECVLATNAADAVIAFGHLLPGLVILQPSVERDRGGVLLEELQLHPDAPLLRVVILGETVPGFEWPVEPLPLEPEHFAAVIADHIRTADEAAAWSVLETAPPAAAPGPHEPPHEPEAWRATPPHEREVDPAEAARVEVPEPRAILDATPPDGTPVTALEDQLFGDLHADVEAAARRSVDASLPRPSPPEDEALERLEAEVRSEARRRREAREAATLVRQPAPPSPPSPGEVTARYPPEYKPEQSFADLSDASTAEATSRADEVLARAEQALLEGRAQAEAAARADEADLERLREQLEAATQQAQAHEAALAASREALQRAQADAETERALARARHEDALEALRGEHGAALEALTQRAAELEATKARVSELQAELTGWEELATAEEAKRERAEQQLEAHRRRLAEQQEALAGLQHAVELARTQDAAAAQRADEAGAQLEVLSTQLGEARSARDAAQAELLDAERERDAANAQVGELTSRVEGLLTDVSSTSALAEETARERDALRARVSELERLQPLTERLGSELEAESRRREALEAELAASKQALDEALSKLSSVEATASVATEKVRALEAREVLPLTVGKRALGVARHGTVALEGLARLVSQLVVGNAEVRLGLDVEGGTRDLWFKRGQVIAAESNLELEGLISRARRDGLIDSRQDAELRLLKGAAPREQLEALKSRGFIRDIESVPLVQRYTEQVALDAFTEAQTSYRVVEEAPGPEVLLATVPRPTLPMLAESLRRAVAPDVMLERLGGGEAVPVASESELDLRALGFSERERKMLSWVDGEATVEDLSLASGLKPDVAFRALLVAQLLGVLEVRPGTRRTEPASGQLDLQRLEAKYDEVQDADYFTILGLSRSAGAEDVRRAHQRLTQEFDPLRFSGHPDPAVQQHAQVVANLLEEAARALEDDRRRSEYARHLLD